MNRWQTIRPPGGVARTKVQLISPGKARCWEPGGPVKARKRALKRISSFSPGRSRPGRVFIWLRQALVLGLAVLLLIGVSAASETLNSHEVTQTPTAVVSMPNRVNRLYESGGREQKPVRDEAPAAVVTEDVQTERPEITLTAARGSGQTIRMLATAYTLECGNGDGVTATGTTPRPGIIAVDPKVIPHGTLVYINDFGYFRAEDTGGVIKGNRIDVFMHSRADALKFGKRWVDVKIIGKFDEPGLVQYFPR